MSSFQNIYDLLDVRFDHSLGESFYRDKVEEVYNGLSKHQICQEDDGALVVFHPEHKRFAKQPFIIRKSDGASNYATTDLATLGYRQKEWEAEQIIYVTDGRQRDTLNNYSSPLRSGTQRRESLPTSIMYGLALFSEKITRQ